MTKERAEELKALFTDPATLLVVSPLIEELADVEDRIQALKKEPMVRYHPRDRSIQKSTPSARLYKDLLAKQTDIVRILLRQLNRDGDDDGDSPLREYLRRMEEESRCRSPTPSTRGHPSMPSSSASWSARASQASLRCGRCWHDLDRAGGTVRDRQGIGDGRYGHAIGILSRLAGRGGDGRGDDGMTVVKTNGHLERYYEDCLAKRHIIGSELRTVLRQLMEDMDSEDWIYDTTEADRRMSFMEGAIRMVKAPFYGQPLRLLPWQKAFLSAVYGFRTPDGLPRFQRVLLLVSRKNGKSSLCSALLLTDMIIGGRGRDIVCSSNDDLQADILFQVCDTMRLMLDPRSQDTWRNQKGLKCLINDNRMFKLSDKTRNKEGHQIDTAVVDEVHQMRDNVIVKSIEQSQSVKDDPLLIMITTEGVVNEGFLDAELRRARAIISGETDDLASRRYLPWLYTQDSEREVWEGNRENRLWMKSNPTLGVVKRWDYLEQQVDLARQSRADRAFVLCKDFNVKQNSSEAWLMPEDYSYDLPVDIEALRGSVCLGGVDLAETTDLSCAKAFVMLPGDPTKHILTQYFVPEGKLSQSDDRSAGAQYDKWAREGLLKVCPGNYMDIGLVADWFLSLYRDYGIRPYRIGYDARFATDFVQRMEQYGFDTELVYQSPEVLNTPIKMVEADLRSHHIAGLSEMDRWCFSNACLKVDSRGNGLLVKADGLHSRRIDGAVTTAIAYEVYRRCRGEYETIVSKL